MLHATIGIVLLVAWSVVPSSLYGRDLELGHVASAHTRGPHPAIAVFRNYLYLAGEAGLQVFDRATKPSPARVAGFFTNTFNGFQEIVISGSTAYLLDASAGLHIFDFSFPDRPVLVGRYAGSGIMSGLAVQGQYAYVANFIGVLRHRSGSEDMTAQAARFRSRFQATMRL